MQSLVIFIWLNLLLLLINVENVIDVTFIECRHIQHRIGVNWMAQIEPILQNFQVVDFNQILDKRKRVSQRISTFATANGTEHRF